jgi:hypothetical protein
MLLLPLYAFMARTDTILNFLFVQFNGFLIVHHSTDLNLSPT